MTSIFDNEFETAVITPGNLRELVRGHEHKFLSQLEPIVRRQSVTVDFRHIERVDAAGVAALISLYADARAAGHNFAIENISQHVAEVLCLVGLDRILLSHNAVPCPQSDPCFQRSAA